MTTRLALVVWLVGLGFEISRLPTIADLSWYRGALL